MAVGIVVAAGESRRMGEFGDKQFAVLGDRPLLVHSLDAFERCDVITQVVVVCAAGSIGRSLSLASEHGLSKVGRVVAGGSLRQQSVRNGLELVDDDSVVAVHDGARPLVTPELIARAVAALPGWDGVIVGIPATDTVKQVDDDGRVRATLDRDRIWLAQTPQVFMAGTLKEALARAQESEVEATDDAASVERAGGRITIVEGSVDNIKVTVPGDIERAESILAARRSR